MGSGSPCRDRPSTIPTVTKRMDIGSTGHLRYGITVATVACPWQTRWSTMDSIVRPGVISIPRYIYLSTMGSGSPCRDRPSTTCPGTRGTVAVPPGRNSINPHFAIPTLISLVETQSVTCWQNRLAISREGQIPAASSANRVQPTVRVDCRHVRLSPVGTRAPLPSVPAAKSSMKILNSTGESGQPCRTPRNSLQESE